MWTLPLPLLLLMARAAHPTAAAVPAILRDRVVTIPERIQGGLWWEEQQLQLSQQQRQQHRAHYWQARVDNFNASDERTYRQRFFLDDQYFDPSGG